jgi:phage shock protein PspC (stress-responsive transcriptional regulator)
MCGTPHRRMLVVAAAHRLRRTKEESALTKTLTRSRHDRVIAGVCAGLADRFGLSPLTVRVLFVLSCLLPGPQFLIYIALWIIMPEEKD